MHRTQKKCFYFFFWMKYANFKWRAKFSTSLQLAPHKNVVHPGSAWIDLMKYQLLFNQTMISAC